MIGKTAAKTADQVLNGVNVTQLGETGKELSKQPELGKFRFKVENEWSGDGGYSTSTVQPFYGVGQERPHKKAFQQPADEPEVLLGQDRGANPVEHLLGSLASCLTGALVYHAAARGIELRQVTSKLEGELDVRGFMGISSDVRKGCQKIRVDFEVDADASPEQLRELAEFSPVFDSLRNGVPIELKIRKQI